MALLYKTWVAFTLLLPGISFAQAKLTITGAKVDANSSVYITTGTVSVADSGLLNMNNGTLKVGDSIRGSGNINLGNGTLELIGNNLQFLPLSPFVNNAVNNLIISNSSAGGVSIGGPLDIYNSLTFSGTGKRLITNDKLTFKSTATNTARLGDMTGNILTGKATVERYISARKAWHLLSVPTNTTQTVRQTWQEGATSSGANPVPGFGIQITSNRATWAADGFDSYSAGGPSVKKYDPNTNTWTGITSTSNTIKATDGYLVFIRGDRTTTSASPTPTQTVLRTKGDLYIGDQAPIPVVAGKFTAIGNPYPSVIDMRNIVKTGIKDFFYLWDPALAGYAGYGAYQTFSNDGSGNYVVTPGGGSFGPAGSVSNYIASGQAFFVQGDTRGGSLTFKEAAKTTESGVSSVPTGLPKPQIRAILMGFNTDNTSYITDGLLINYDDSYSNTIDDMDAIKSANAAENLSVKTAGQLLVVERRHTITTQDTIFLNLTGVKAQKYRFELTADQLYRPGLTAFLEDNYLHTRTPLYVDGVTDVDFTIVNIPGSYAADRFRIVFTPALVLPVTFTSIKAYQQNTLINIEWKVDNESNMKQYQVEQSTDGNHFSLLSSVPAMANGNGPADYGVTDAHPVEGYNYYRVKSVDDDGKAAYTNVVKVLMGKLQQGITLYPNPVVNGIIGLQLNNQPEGEYGIRLLTKSGQVVMQTQLEHTGGSSTETVSFDKHLAHGIYQLEVTKPDGTASEINVVY